MRVRRGKEMRERRGAGEERRKKEEDRGKK